MTEKLNIKTITLKKRWQRPTLSVLIPYFRDNPAELVKSLVAQCADKNVEILVYDDGTGDKAVNATLSSIAKSSESLCVKLLLAEQNRGRSFARNRLMLEARAEWVLFLDADMLPCDEAFVQKYLDAIKAENTDIIFGGFQVEDKAQRKDLELHRAFSETSDALDANARNLYGPQYVCSSNLCVKKSVLEAEPFDDGFQGWGWEDSEWAARVATKYRLAHADIPALHLGLETTDTLLSRFQTSGPNYLRFTQKHPEIARSLKLYSVVQKVKHLPGQKLCRPLLKFMVKLNVLPIRLRLLALKLWRASWYAESFS